MELPTQSPNDNASGLQPATERDRGDVGVLYRFLSRVRAALGRRGVRPHGECPMQCPNCATETAAGQRYCKRCGAEVKGPYAVSPASAAAPPSLGTHRWAVGVTICAAAAAAGALWLASGLSRCKYIESSPSYSPDDRFYTQMQMTLCRDHAQSHVRLVMGKRGSEDKRPLLDLGADIGTVHLSWQEGPEFHVQASSSAITHRYGPYADLPAVVVRNP
jgi:hypothetical protein